MYFIICLFGLGILAKVFYIQFAEGEGLEDQATNMTVELRTIPAIKGNIYAADGHSILATSEIYYEIRMDLKVSPLTDEIFNENVDSLAWYLANMFGDRSALEYANGLKEARAEGNRYYLVVKNVKYTQLKELKQFPIFELGQYKGGIIAIEMAKRVRPFGMLAARTIGYDRHQPGARVGLEYAYSDYLNGVDGAQYQQKIAGGHWKPLTDDYEIEPRDGSDVYTTIDINIQDVAERALEEQLSAHEADNGCVIVMDVETGYVRAIANLTKITDGDQTDYFEYYNYGIGASTEPGSVFKLPAIMVALDHGVVDLDDSIETGNGTYKFFDQTMRDSKHGGWGTISVKEAIAYSSNVAVSRITFENYYDQPQVFMDKLHAMGIGQKLNIDIAGEGDPVLKDPSEKSTWYGTTLPWMSIGYEVQQTPLQTLTFYNAIANGGRMMKPQFVSHIRNNGNLEKEFEPVVINEAICSSSTIGKVQECLEAVVEMGTATNLKDAHFEIAGKTGTSWIDYGAGQGGKKYQASFVGYFPADQPKYSCIVVINNPTAGQYYGNQVAGPIFKEIANKVYANNLELQNATRLNTDSTLVPLPYSRNGYWTDLEMVFTTLDLPMHYEGDPAEWVVTSTGHDQVSVYSRKHKKTLIPEVVGMGLNDAIYLLENMGLVVKVKGSGVIREQSMDPGAEFVPGQQIELILR